MSNLFFYQYLVFANGSTITVSGLVGATDGSPASATRLANAIRDNVLEQGFSEDLLNLGRLLSIKRV